MWRCNRGGEAPAPAGQVRRDPRRVGCSERRVRHGRPPTATFEYTQTPASSLSVAEKAKDQAHVMTVVTSWVPRRRSAALRCWCWVSVSSAGWAGAAAPVPSRATGCRTHTTWNRSLRSKPRRPSRSSWPGAGRGDETTKSRDREIMNAVRGVHHRRCLSGEPPQPSRQAGLPAQHGPWLGDVDVGPSTERPSARSRATGWPSSGSGPGTTSGSSPTTDSKWHVADARRCRTAV